MNDKQKEQEKLKVDQDIIKTLGSPDWVNKLLLGLATACCVLFITAVSMYFYLLSQGIKIFW